MTPHGVRVGNMSNPLIVVRGARREDANDLLDIDIKCFENAWTPEEWSKLGFKDEHAISLVTYYGEPVGFIVMKTEGSNVRICKIAVKAYYRKKELSLHLLAVAVRYGQDRHADLLEIIVPEGMIYPGPGSIIGWLRSVGFKGTQPFIKNHFNVYGEHEDGVRFIADLKRSA